MQKSIIVGIIVSRYVVLPFLGILVLKGAVHFGMVQSDPLYQFVLLLQFAVPPAMNIGTQKLHSIENGFTFRALNRFSVEWFDFLFSNTLKNTLFPF